MSLTETIQALSNLPGVSSWEEPVRDYLAAEARAVGCSTEIDRLGNLIVRKEGAHPARGTVLLTAHMDEVGLMITDITEEGYLRFDLVGKPDRRCLIGKQMLVNGIPGVIGIKAIHLTDREETKKVPPTDSLYLDIGAEDEAAAKKLVSLGNVAWFRRSCALFGAGLVKGPALTGRIPCAVLLELLRGPVAADCTMAFTVQQEVGSRGAFGAGFRIKPDAAVVVDTIPANDVPGGKRPGLGLGGGVGIALRDEGALYDPNLSAALYRLAQEKHLPAALLTGGSASQGGTVQCSRAGAKTAAIKLPVRYGGTPACVADPADAETALALLRAYLEQV